MSSEQEQKIKQIINKIIFFGGDVSDDMVDVITKVVESGPLTNIEKCSEYVYFWNRVTKLLQKEK